MLEYAHKALIPIESIPVIDDSSHLLHIECGHLSSLIHQDSLCIEDCHSEKVQGFLLFRSLRKKNAFSPGCQPWKWIGRGYLVYVFLLYSSHGSTVAGQLDQVWAFEMMQLIQ